LFLVEDRLYSRHLQQIEALRPVQVERVGEIEITADVCYHQSATISQRAKDSCDIVRQRRAALTVVAPAD
jgi:hypothetical protein